MIFAALDAEEIGLRGAEAFVKQPPVEASALVLNLNMDMIGRDPNNLLYVAGSHQMPFLKPFIERVAAKAPVKLVMGHDDPTQKGVENWTGSSDHARFCQARIPCLYFGVEDFDQHHRATDDYETMTHAFYVRAVETMIAVVKEFDARAGRGRDRARAVDQGRAAIDEIACADARAAAVAGALAALTVSAGSVARQAPPAVSLAVPGGTVEGTLLMPGAASGKVPVVLIIAGSGPTDRDGNSALLPGQSNSYRMLAEALAAQGIASLRYDKRGIGASKVANLSERDLRFETFVQDAASWVSFLRNDARFGTITVLGHSMGSLIGMLAARAARADAFVSVAGVAKSAPDVLRDQLRAQLGSAPDLLAAGERVLASLAVRAARRSAASAARRAVPTERAALPVVVVQVHARRRSSAASRFRSC